MSRKPLIEGRGEKPDTPKPNIDEGRWEKEFEDELYSYCHGEFILDLLEKYSLTKKVKIKCKNGCIQIERIGQ